MNSPYNLSIDNDKIKHRILLENKKEISDLDLERHSSGRHPNGNDTCSSSEDKLPLSDQGR